MRQWFCLLIFQAALYTHCLQWSPLTTGETFYALAVQEGYPIGLSAIATQRTARAAYREGVALFRTVPHDGNLTRADYCAQWVTGGTRALGWRD